MSINFYRFKFPVVILLCVSLLASGQSSTPNQTPTPAPVVESKPRIDASKETNRRFETFRKGFSAGNRRRTAAIHFDTINNFYRKPTKKELKLLSPNAADLAKYARFLRTVNTGLVKLFEDIGCADHATILVASEDCLRFSMPGGGASFSFRTATHRTWRLADLTYSGNKFNSLGIFLQGMIVNIGNVPLEDVSLETNGLNFLASFEPPNEFEEAKETDLKISEGIEADGFVYSRSVENDENTTFALRSIAYRGNVYKAYHGMIFDELEFDKRKDIIIVFRVIRRNEDSVTILWKELARKDSPKLKAPEKDYEN